MLDLLFFREERSASPRRASRSRARAAAPARRDRSFEGGRRKVVEEGRRITAPRPSARGRGRPTHLPVPTRYLVGLRCFRARRLVNLRKPADPRQGQRVLAAATVAKARATGIPEIRALYVNDLDTARSPTHAAQPDQEPHGRWSDLPHDAPRRTADARDAAENLFQNLFFNPEALRPFGRQPHEVQPPPRRAHFRGEGRGILGFLHFGRRSVDFAKADRAERRTSDIIDVLKTLIDVRNGNGGRRHRPPATAGALSRRDGRERLPRRPGARQARGQAVAEAGLMPQDMINAAVAAAVKEFFGSSQLAVPWTRTTRCPEGHPTSAARPGALEPERPHAQREFPGARRADPAGACARSGCRKARTSRPDQLARRLRAHERLRLPQDAVPQGHRRPASDVIEVPSRRSTRPST